MMGIPRQLQARLDQYEAQAKTASDTTAATPVAAPGDGVSAATDATPTSACRVGVCRRVGSGNATGAGSPHASRRVSPIRIRLTTQPPRPMVPPTRFSAIRVIAAWKAATRPRSSGSKTA
ncbi:hypothetical protein KEH56_36580 [Burkholderia cenocepacia]|uniref:hypothetical protein n=1 Tax=Burkholderia cenocepacia TaxID=95486 RepID=UPI001BA87A00|nr:hypothetical protein [Burkholderia cenocepacia]QUN44689.1 hypothetical protein KEH56_36580 [Burkholderia cenocepacia]